MLCTASASGGHGNCVRLALAIATPCSVAIRCEASAWVSVLAGPVATVTLPRRVPFGFHGNWIADDDL